MMGAGARGSAHCSDGKTRRQHRCCHNACPSFFNRKHLPTPPPRALFFPAVPQLYLATLALCWFPSKGGMTLVEQGSQGPAGYMVGGVTDGWWVGGPRAA